MNILLKHTPCVSNQQRIINVLYKSTSNEIFAKLNQKIIVQNAYHINDRRKICLYVHNRYIGRPNSLYFPEYYLLMTSVARF